MTTQTTIVCDRCKEEITPGQQREMTLASKAEIDLCPECYRLFTVFLKGGEIDESAATSPENDLRPRVGESVIEYRAMLQRLHKLAADSDGQPGVIKGVLTTAQLRHAILGDLEESGG